jgi:hypothetical protein
LKKNHILSLRAWSIVGLKYCSRGKKPIISSKMYFKLPNILRKCWVHLKKKIYQSFLPSWCLFLSENDDDCWTIKNVTKMKIQIVLQFIFSILIWMTFSVDVWINSVWFDGKAYGFYTEYFIERSWRIIPLNTFFFFFLLFFFYFK